MAKTKVLTENTPQHITDLILDKLQKVHGDLVDTLCLFDELEEVSQDKKLYNRVSKDMLTAYKNVYGLLFNLQNLDDYEYKIGNILELWEVSVGGWEILSFHTKERRQELKAANS